MSNLHRRSRALLRRAGCVSWLAVLAACQPQPSTGALPTGAPPTNAPPPAAAPVAQAETTELRAELELASRLGTGRGVVQDASAAASLLKSAAEAGDVAAQTMLGEYYLAGAGVEQDPQAAARWFEKAAAQNYPAAKADLSILYFNGAGVAKDYGHALSLAHEAAASDNAAAEDVIGLGYLNGWGIAADPAAGIDWLTKSADKKYVPSMEQLGECYRDGHGVTADKVVAYAWFTLAAANAARGSEQSALATTHRDELTLVLLPEDVKRGAQLAAGWKPGVVLASLRHTTPTSPTPPADAVSTTSFRRPAATATAPIVLKQMTIDYEVAPDGSFTKTVHTEIGAENEAAAHDIAQQPVDYSEAMETIEIAEAYTLKRDGRRLPVATQAILTQLVPGSPSEPMFDDQRQKVVIFPNVEDGDAVVVTAKYASKPYIPGLFTLSMPFNRSIAQNDVRVRVTVPYTMVLATDTHDLAFTKRDVGETTVYEWRFANPIPDLAYKTALDPLDRWPRLFASNLRSYDEMARAYQALIEPKLATTPAVRQRADEITAGIGDRRKQAEAIYDWVSRHIRYVGIELGQDAFVPHDAASVLANGYGDCKDHTALFVALLRAKGIPGEVVLINWGASYSLPPVPSLGTLDHAITWLPEFNLYADTTAAVAPFGVLPFGEYGKPVVHLTASGNAVRRTPALAGGAASLTLKTTAQLDADGRIVGDSETAATGPFAVALRQDATVIQSSGTEESAKSMLHSKRYDGTGSFTLEPPFDTAPTYHVTGNFSIDPRPEILAGNSFFMPTGLEIGARPGDFLMGTMSALDLRTDEPTPCYAGRQTEELSLELPEGKQLRELPKGTEIHNDYLQYKSAWSLNGRTVTVHREFSAVPDQPVCVAQARLDSAKALYETWKDYNTAVALIAN